MKRGWFQWVIAFLMSVMILIVYLTTYKKFKGRQILRRFRNKPAIFVVWHGRVMMLPPYVRMVGVNGYAVTSRHRDGRMVGKMLRIFGLKSILGTKYEGATNVLRQGVRRLREGKSIMISPDGPDGPSLRVQGGALYFAKMTGAPIIPICFTSNNAWFQNRWDRCLVVPPFSRVDIAVGDPIYIDKSASLEEFESVRKNLEDIMVKQLRDMDAKYNLFKVEQDQNPRDFGGDVV